MNERSNDKAVEAYWNGWLGVGPVMKKWKQLSPDTQDEERPDIVAGLEAAAPHIIAEYIGALKVDEKMLLNACVWKQGGVGADVHLSLTETAENLTRALVGRARDAPSPKSAQEILHSKEAVKEILGIVKQADTDRRTNPER